MKFTRTVLIAAALMISCSAHASQLTYRPTNPSLGGDPLNGNWLLSQASAQGEGASQSPGFSIDFPDFGGTTQPTPDPAPLPPVDGQ